MTFKHGMHPYGTVTGRFTTPAKNFLLQSTNATAEVAAIKAAILKQFPDAVELDDSIMVNCDFSKVEQRLLAHYADEIKEQGKTK
jgi:hypothetical protein